MRMIPTTQSGLSGTYAIALSSLIAEEIRRQRADRTVGMSRDNLWAITAVRASYLPGSPRGTNARYYAHRTFNEVCDHLPPSLRNFLLT